MTNKTFFSAILFAAILATQPGAAQSGAAGFAAVAGQKGGQDQTGPYEVVPNWPKPLSQLKGHENWTWGAVQSIYAESPNRVFILMRGELPNLKRPEEVPIPNVGPSLSYPVSQAPFRNASVGPVSSPGNSGSDGWNGWKGKMGVDARWEHCLFVVNANGDITETFPEWDSKFRRPHSVTINPYDPEKHVWVVDDRMHAVYKFTHDVRHLVQTLGVPGVSGNDDKHFNRPTFLAWLPDSTMYVSDGYANTRAVKFDKNGKFLDQFSTGKPSTPQVLFLSADKYLWIADNDTSKIIKYDLGGHYLYSWGSGGQWPGAMWNVHGMSVDQEGNFYIAEVNNGRPQKFRPRAGASKAMLVGQPIRSAWR